MLPKHDQDAEMTQANGYKLKQKILPQSGPSILQVIFKLFDNILFLRDQSTSASDGNFSVNGCLDAVKKIKTGTPRPQKYSKSFLLL